jgi:hypothetical protein
MRGRRSLRSPPSGRHFPHFHFALGAGLPLVALPAHASFGGSIHIGFGGMFVAAAALAIPGAALAALIEWIGAKRPPWRWLGVLAACAAAYCSVVALGLGGKADAVFFWFPVPPLATLALVALVRNARERMFTAWLVAGGALGAGVYRALAIPRRDPDELVGLLVGGALVSMLLWQLAHALRQRGLRAAASGAQGPAAIGPDAATAAPNSHAIDPVAVGATNATRPAPATALAAELRTGLDAARADLGRRARTLPTGARWFLGGGILFYLAIGVMTAAGFDTLFEAMRSLEWRIADLFGLRTQSLEGKPLAVWSIHGVAWSAIAGFGTWSAAALGGRFEPGPLQPLRFAGLVLCFVMFVAILAATGKLRFY